MKLRIAFALALAPPLMACPGPISNTAVEGGLVAEAAYEAARLYAMSRLGDADVTAAQALRIRNDNRTAFEAVCYTRSAVDIALRRTPAARIDPCPASTKTGAIPTVAEALMRAAQTVRALNSTASEGDQP